MSGSDRELAASRVTLHRASAQDVQPWRHAWLRPHQAPSAACFNGDDAGLHIVARDADQVVGIGTALRDAHPAVGRAPAELQIQTGDVQFRLRGMATRPDRRSAGIGSAVLQALLTRLQAQGCALVWCNARVPASAFYLRHGFSRIGDAYEIPEIGPHYLMSKVLHSGDAIRR